MKIQYKIKFYSDWHCGSGLSSGADSDLLVIKDKDGFPFIPGKTIKGLVREAVEEINELSVKKFNDEIKTVFGVFDANEKAIQGCCFFTNATIKDGLADVINKSKLQEHLYRSISSTAIDENGVADAHSLRTMEVTIPCELIGNILDIPDNYFIEDENGDVREIAGKFGEVLVNGLKFIKRLGQNRNRGLGRCLFEITSIKKEGYYENN